VVQLFKTNYSRDAALIGWRCL